MAKIQIKHIDAYSDTDFIQCKSDSDTLDIIEISGVCDDQFFSINLDVSTSIKLAKTLRTEINKIKGI